MLGIISNPRYVALDTGTINDLSDKAAGGDAKQLLSILRGGDWMPFLTYHHLEELACHQNDDVFKRRFDFICGLPYVACMERAGLPASVGSIVDLREYEIEFFLAHPNATHQEIIESVRPKVRSGFYSGSQLLNKNRRWLEFFRTNLAEIRRHSKAVTANLAHFPVPDMKEKIPKKGEAWKICSEREAVANWKQKAARLKRQVSEHGDCRHINPQELVRDFMCDVLDGAVKSLAASGDAFENYLKEAQVDRDRLPTNARIEDVIYENVFVMEMGIHARNLLKNKDEMLKLIRKEALPSWLVWQELDRHIRQLPNAESGNLGDKDIASFGPYVDLLNADKRIAEMLKQASRQNQLLLQVYRRVPEHRGLKGLIEALKNN